MAATQTLSHASALSQIPKSGVVTLTGFGIKVGMQSGHLSIEDGLGPERRHFLLPRIGHRLKRLVCISEDGFVTLSALTWLSDIGAAFVMLDRFGKVRIVTGPTSTADVRLRRAQGLALQNGAGLIICRELIQAKLEGQERVLREHSKDPIAADTIRKLRILDLLKAETFDRIRFVESQAAVSYFSSLRDVQVLWPKADLRRIPQHWRTVGARQSPLSSGPRLAVTPFHAVLNFCFALLESETRLAVTSLGLDGCVGLGLHTDTPNRDSLAFDVLEPVRPEIETWLLAWIGREPLRKSDFFETSTGNCRLTSHLCARLCETAPAWGRLVAPWAEKVARMLLDNSTAAKGARQIPTHLTQQHRREVHGHLELPRVSAPAVQKVCRVCGVILSGRQRNRCALCGVGVSRDNMIELARKGRVAAKAPESRARMSASQARQNKARRGWLPSSLPEWLTQSSYREMILPRLSGITVPVLAQTLDVSEPYAAKVRKGQYVPHPLHWQSLAALVGVTGPS